MHRRLLSVARSGVDVSERTFIDEITIRVQAGAGGDGAMSYQREKYKPKGKPDGGNGGHGGSIVLRVDPQVSTLRELAREPHRTAPAGGNGSKRDKVGRDAEDVVIAVPNGTEVRAEDGELLADLVGAGTEFVVARGGRGGRGNASFITTRRRSPAFAERGEPGEQRTVQLTLKVLADVGLAGFPNAGKSSLLRAVTAATPEVAAYPFTTLSPQLGVADAAGRIVIADVPGLIEGASEGRGLGHAFLRHLERCPVLCVLLDPTDPERMPGIALPALLDELEAYDPALAARVGLVAITKADLATPEQLDAARNAATARDHVVISAETGDGLPELLERLQGLVAAARATRTDRSRRLIRIRPASAKVAVRAAGTAAWQVECEAAERLLRRFDPSNPDALAYLQDRFDSLGIDAALEAAGARAGDDVRLGELVFTYTPDHGFDDEHEDEPIIDEDEEETV